MHVSIHVGCVRKILLPPFCTALHMDDFCPFCLIVVHKAWTTSTLLPRCAPIGWHMSMKYGLLLNTSIAKLSICIWTTKAFCPSIYLCAQMMIDKKRRLLSIPLFQMQFYQPHE